MELAVILHGLILIKEVTFDRIEESEKEQPVQGQESGSMPNVSRGRYAGQCCGSGVSDA